MTEPVATLQEFFEQARQGQLTAVRCGRCGALAIPPKQFCPECSQRAWEPTSLSGRGTIASYTVIRVAPPIIVMECFSHPRQRGELRPQLEERLQKC